MTNNRWNLWNKLPQYGDLFYKRATGKAPEMESSKSVSHLLKNYYKPGDRVCDVGCGAGHYLSSLRKRLDKNINYIGVDSTEYYIKLARKAFGADITFVRGSIFDLPFPKNNFDIVICCNVLLHLPPPLIKPLFELVRISKKYIIVRLLVGESNYIIKRIYEPDEIQNGKTKESDLIKSDQDIKCFGYFNMYTKKYLKEIVYKIHKTAKVTILPDNKFNDFDNSKVRGAFKKIATRAINGKQISGNLIYNWHYLIIEK